MKTKKSKHKRTNIIGTRVMKTRQEQGLTRRALVKKLRRLGIKTNVLLQLLLEKRKRRVFDIEFCAIAIALNVTMDSLLDTRMFLVCADEKYPSTFRFHPLFSCKIIQKIAKQTNSAIFLTILKKILEKADRKCYNFMRRSLPVCRGHNGRRYTTFCKEDKGKCKRKSVRFRLQAHRSRKHSSKRLSMPTSTIPAA